MVKRLSVLIQSHSREWLCCFIALVILAGCAGKNEPAKLSGATMGTVWHLSYIPVETGPDENELLMGIESALERVDRSMSTYRRDSEISYFNMTSPGKWFKPSGDFIEVMKTALDIGERSDGAYDVTVSPLVDLWGFGPDGVAGIPPSDSEVAQTMRLVGQQNIELDPIQYRVRKSSMLAVDFSSLAKGYAVDQVADWLVSQGITRFMLEVGGEMRLSGLSARDDPWRIAIEQPDSSERSVATAISLTDVALATSGDYRNYFESEGQRYSHTIDPRSGYPVEHDLVSVTVVHQSCMVADAWATALIVLGHKRAMAVAKAEGLAVYFIRSVNGDFKHSHTAQFSRYLDQQAL